MTEENNAIESEGTDDSKIYLSQRDLFDEIMKCKLNDDTISDKLGEMFILLASRYVNHRSFVRYEHLRSDLIAAGVAACCRAFYKFRPYKDTENEWDGVSEVVYDYKVCSNPFAYMTTSIHNGFLQILKREYAYTNAVNATRLQEGYDASYGYTDMIAEKESEGAEEGEQVRIDPHLERMSLWGDDEEEEINEVEW